MLPGFRFLFAAVILSMSILIFGLGAAALLRAAHEEFASMPSRRAPAEQVFARQNDAPPPTLALLRFEPPAPEKSLENVPPTAAAGTVAPAGQTPDMTPAEPEKLAALKPAEPMPVETAKPDTPASETATATAALPAEAEASVVKEEIKVAISETAAPSIGTAPVAAGPTPDTPSLESNLAATRIATLGGPAVIIDEKTSASTTDAKPGRSIVRKRSAERARERRRIAARRAKLARQAAAAAQQQQASPFGQSASGRATQ